MNISVHEPTYLSDDEVNLIFDENIELLPYLGLDGGLALAFRIEGTPCDAASHEDVPLLGHLPGYAARGFVDLSTLMYRDMYLFIAMVISKHTSV